MTVAKPGDKILVTGANGYIGIWVVKMLLEKGYNVVAQVRSEKKGRFIVESFKSYGEGRVEIAIVESISAEGAFDEAVKGLDGIIHVASPVRTDLTEVQRDFIDPAVNGTLSVLKSALNVKTIKRIVDTSSIAAICTPDVSRPQTEKDWNDAAVALTEELGIKAGFSVYAAAKTLAEKAAWNFWNTHKDEVSWDLAVINPPFVYGPCIHEMASPADINATMALWWDQLLTPGNPVLNAEGKVEYVHAEAMDHGSAWVDVRDIALAHVLALENEAAGGERIIVSGGEFIWNDWVKAAPASFKANRKATGMAAMTGIFERSFDTSKEKQIFGMKLRTMEETFKDTLEDFEKRGW